MNVIYHLMKLVGICGFFMVFGQISFGQLISVCNYPEDFAQMSIPNQRVKGLKKKFPSSINSPETFLADGMEMSGDELEGYLSYKFSKEGELSQLCKKKCSGMKNREHIFIQVNLINDDFDIISVFGPVKLRIAASEK